MPNVFQMLRSAVARRRPTGRQPGEIGINFADRQMFYVDAAGAAQDVVAVPFYSAATTYAIGDLVRQGADLYECRTAIGVPEAFDSAKWRAITHTRQALDARYLELAGGTLTGPLMLDDGTVAAPSLTLGTADTGLYRAGADQVNIAVKGVQRFTVSDDWARFDVGTFRIDSPTAAITLNKHNAGGSSQLIGAINNGTLWTLMLGDGAVGDRAALTSHDPATNAVTQTPLIVETDGTVTLGERVRFPNPAQAGAGPTYLGPSAVAGTYNSQDMGEASIAGTVIKLQGYHIPGTAAGMRLYQGVGYIQFDPPYNIVRSFDSATAQFNPPSDVRMKENIVETTVDALATLKAMKVASFDWMTGLPVSGHVPVGFVAQDVKVHVPEAVTVRQTGGEHGLPADLHSVDNGALVPYLVRAIQQLAAEVDALKHGRQP